ncbi:SiaB family protein kinase [Bacteroidota bacterium]
MNWTDFHEFFRLIEDDSLSLFYRGDFADDITIRLIDLSESHFTEGKEQMSIKKKVSFLMAECFQNVIRYGEDITANNYLQDQSGYFMTRYYYNKYYIASGNLVEQSKILLLKEKIENINKLSKEELKQLYMKVLGTDEFTAKGGAGLGLIEMARKSGRKLEAEFEMINELMAYFYLQMIIDSDENNESEVQKKGLHIDHAVQLNQLLRKNSIIMAYQGDFRQHTILPLLNMIEKNLMVKRTKYAAYKTLFHVLVEMLQNVMHHGLTVENKKEGLFTIGLDGQHFIISSANYVETAKLPALKELFDYFLSLDDEQLKQKSKDILREREDGPFGGSGLGVIDIIRAGTLKPNYVIVPVDDHKFLFYLNVKV